MSLGYLSTKKWAHNDDVNYKNVHYVYYGDGQLLPDLRILGVFNNKHIPKEYLSAGVTQRLELLAGLIDSDGTVDVKGRVMFSNTSKVLIDQYFQLVQSLNLRSLPNLVIWVNHLVSYVLYA